MDRTCGGFVEGEGKVTGGMSVEPLGGPGFVLYGADWGRSAVGIDMCRMILPATEEENLSELRMGGERWSTFGS
jgi:hypothetical protein